MNLGTNLRHASVCAIEFSDNLMAYATYSTGYRAGGFNGRVNSVEEATQPYDPETVDNIEVGIKSEWMDSRVRFNASYFVMNYDDKQEELQLPSDTGTGQKTVVTNASEATIQGLEFEVQALIGKGFSLRANMGFLDTEYDNFQYTDAVSLETVDLSYLEFRRAPDVTATVDGTYEWDTAAGSRLGARLLPFPGFALGERDQLSGASQRKPRPSGRLSQLGVQRLAVQLFWTQPHRPGRLYPRV